MPNINTQTTNTNIVISKYYNNTKKNELSLKKILIYKSNKTNKCDIWPLFFNVEPDDILIINL